MGYLYHFIIIFLKKVKIKEGLHIIGYNIGKMM